MTDCITAKAFAKLNLTLDITGRREDGYHSLRMVMQSISLHDTLTLQKTEGAIQLSCGTSGIPCDCSNTAYRAAALFFTYTGLKNSGVSIKLKKEIPSQAGMGGGSADAAAVLRALNRLYKTDLSMDALRAIGLQIGADVPFCVEGGSCLAEGIGEVLKKTPPLPSCWITVCRPPVGVCTREAFSKMDAGGFPCGNDTPLLLSVLDSGDLRKISAAFGNAFQNVLSISGVEEIKERMCACGALNACMTGSGSAVFGVFEQREEARACAASLRNQYDSVYLCRPAYAGVELDDRHNAGL